MSTISSKLIMEALQYYQELGYQLIDVPQVVDFEVSQYTKPAGVPELFHRGMKVYVGSAEQSFLQLHKEGKLPNGKYVAMTPCHRTEACLDDTHYTMFLKIELIEVGSEEVLNCVKDAWSLFNSKIPCHAEETDEGYLSYDLLTNEEDGVELGSYGVRKTLDGTSYVYGTGLAEPRFSVVLDKFKSNN